ncbi:MAG: hypothetical protein ACE5I1_04700 [bacterium]
MKVPKIRARQAMVGVSEGIATLRINRSKANPAATMMESKVLQRLLSILRKIISPVFSVQNYELFECDDVKALPPLTHYTDIHVETYDGSIAIPDNVVEVIKYKRGEALTVVTVARRVVGYIRAAFKDMHAPECDVQVNVRSGDVYLYESKILDDYRGMGLSKYMLVSAARAFHNRGFNKVLVGSIVNGRQSRVDIERAGFRTFLEISAYKFLGQRVNVLTRKN